MKMLPMLTQEAKTATTSFSFHLIDFFSPKKQKTDFILDRVNSVLYIYI
jgi:hypothetical protein